MLRHSAERGARTVRAEEQSSGTALSRTLRTAEPSVVAVPYVCEVRSHFFFEFAYQFTHVKEDKNCE